MNVSNHDAILKFTKQSFQLGFYFYSHQTNPISTLFLWKSKSKTQKKKKKKKPLLAYVRSPGLLFRKEKSFHERLKLLGELMRQSNLEINRREYSRTNRRLYLQSSAFRDRIVFGYSPDTDETEGQPRIYTDFDFLYVTDHNHNVVGRR